MKIKKRAHIWNIYGESVRLTFNEKTFCINAMTKRKVWQSDAAAKPGIKVLMEKEECFIPFAEFLTKTVTKYTTGYYCGVKINLRDCIAGGTKVPVVLTLLVAVENKREEIVFHVIPDTNTNNTVTECRWPQPFTFTDRGKNCYSVVPDHQGMLLPNDWETDVSLEDGGRCFSRGLYMQWWGQVTNDTGYMAIYETPWDAGCIFSHPAGGPTSIHPVWYASLGRMCYNRSVRYIFFNSQCNYATMAKRYRRYVKETGIFRTLKEKTVDNPLIKKLIGAPIIHTSILYHCVQGSNRYKKNLAHPENNHVLTSFHTRIKQLKNLKRRGLSNAYVHLDGWGKSGYDNLVPDVFPPCPEAGGWKGMSDLSKVCRELGYVFAIHDQYRDYYKDADTYNEELSIRNVEGNVPKMCHWDGGEQTFLCAQFALGYVQRNITEILRNGIDLQGAYLDVFTAIVPDECYHPMHSMTRRECIEYWKSCFNYIRSKGMVVSSEEPIDWAVPHIDLVHHAPYMNGYGIPVPLFNLVYHDCIVTPWFTEKATKRVAPYFGKDSGFLHGLLNGGPGYLTWSYPENVDLDFSEAEMEQCRIISGLFQKVGYEEMLSHEFLKDDYRKQRTTFSNGIIVEVDFDTDNYRIFYR
jgi:hypothetical protein